jgi:basic amino acid/polyamine antiporter, APA family
LRSPIQCLRTIYNDLLDYVIFAVLTIGGLFRLRRTRPDTAAQAGVRCAAVTTARPYRAVGYPILPALYMLVAGVIEILLLINKPAFTVRGWKKEVVS